MIISPDDKVINPALAKERFESASSSVKRLLEVTDSVDASRHVLAGDILSPNTTDRLAREIVDFHTATDGPIIADLVFLLFRKKEVY